MAKAAGCAAKLNPATLDAILRKLPRPTDPNVLVGFDTNDDAGIYLLAEGLASGADRRFLHADRG